MPLAIKLVATFGSISILSGIVAVLCVMFEDKRIYSFWWMVLQWLSIAVAVALGIVYGLIQLWK